MACGGESGMDACRAEEHAPIGAPLLPKPARRPPARSPPFLSRTKNKKTGGDNAPARSCFLPLASLPAVSVPVGVLPPASVLSSRAGPGARPGPMRSERDAPAVERAGIAPAAVLHAQVPGAVEALARQVDRIGLVDVVAAPATAVVQLVHAAIRRNQVDPEIADVAVRDLKSTRLNSRHQCPTRI